MTAPRSYNIIDVAKDAVRGDLEYAADHTKQTRLATCKACDNRNAALEVCTSCGCWIPGKVKFLKSSCPLGKW